MFNKLVDVFREVFWLKRPKKKNTQRKTPVKKKISAKKKVAAKKAPAKALKVPSKPLKVIKAPAAPKVPKILKKKEPVIDPNLTEIGEITHYFERIKVCVVKVTGGAILIGDRLSIIGTHTKIAQKVWSMQIESLDVKVAKKGQLVGLKVDKPVQVGDKIYK
jgi:hypothetical protein